jgi:hypothetical protein
MLICWRNRIPGAEVLGWLFPDGMVRRTQLELAWISGAFFQVVCTPRGVRHRATFPLSPPQAEELL